MHKPVIGLLVQLLSTMCLYQCQGQCPALTDPTNGGLYYHNGVLASYQRGDQVTYVCDAGFGIEGTSGTGTRTCDGTAWSGSVIGCSEIRCPPLADYPNSLVVYVPDTTSPYDFGTVAINLCLDGYYLIGSIFQYCGGHGSSSIGTWDGTPGSCARVECTSLTPPLNGALVHSDSTSPHDFMTTANYSCHFGTHRLSASGNSVRTCIKSGMGPGIWNGTSPTCEALTCDALANPSNGRWRYNPSGSPYYVAVVATLSCNMGFLVTGNGERNCISDSVGLTALWDGSVTYSCRAIMCSALPALTNGMISYSRTPSSGMYSYNTIASHTCNEGLYVTGSSIRTCGTDEVEAWDGTTATCIPITCDILSVPMDGFILYAPDMTVPFKYMTFAIYNCNTTFGLTGGDRMRTCVGSRSGPGKWNGTAPSCILLTCRELSEPANGNITYSSTPYVYGTEAIYICRRGFGINGGTRIRTCGGDGSSSIGTWSEDPPACDTVQCDRIPPLENGGTSYYPDDVAPYDFETTVTQFCHAGFYRNGVRNRQCEIHDGLTTVAQWNGEDAQCISIMCTDVPVPTNGVVTYRQDTIAPYSYHTIATHSCIPGFGPDDGTGDIRRFCTRSGTPDGFNGTAPKCVDVVCFRLPPILNGALNYSTTPNADNRYEYRSIGTYTCDMGFYLEGSEMLTCDSDGTNRFGFWNGTQPACTDFDECAGNDVICKDPTRECNNTMGSYECICTTGYIESGTDCIVYCDYCTLEVLIGSVGAVTVVLLLVFASVSVCCIIYCWRRHVIQKQLNARVQAMVEIMEMSGITSSEIIDFRSQTLRDLLVQFPEALKIPTSHIKLSSIPIGQGVTGVVYKGQLLNWNSVPKQDIAVKTLKGLFSILDVKSLASEVIKMNDFHHPNVMSLIGVCLDTGAGVSILMPFMANGCLLDYVRRERGSIFLETSYSQNQVQSVRKLLLKMCHQIALGMEYLAGKMFVHRDLAARNCLLDQHGNIKVGDFGLTEDIYTTGYFRQGNNSDIKLPYKWMAIESLNGAIFTEKSDVWSYGVTVWEVFSAGRTPYSLVDPQSLIELLEEGQRLQMPTNAACSTEIYTIMQKCWLSNPNSRPSFSELVSVMVELLTAVSDSVVGLTINLRHDVQEPSDGYKDFNSLVSRLCAQMQENH